MPDTSIHIRNTDLRERRLAIDGGPPLFAEPLHVGRPNIGDRASLHRRLDEILDRRWLTNGGPLVAEFEQRLSLVFGVPEVVAVCNATIGLQILISTLSLSGEAIVPSFTFPALPNVLTLAGIRPVFADVVHETHNLDPDHVESLISPLTSAIFGVHTWGRPCDVEALQRVGDRHGLPVIFDAAHAFGCTYRQEQVGRFGRAEVFSFHATKVLNAFEGGAIATGDHDLAEKLRLARNFGFVGYDETAVVGTNGKMSEISAAMGLTGLESYPKFVAHNASNYELYRALLSSTPGVSVLAYDAMESHNYQYVVVEVNAQRSGVDRDRLHRTLWAENVLARRYFYPGCHRLAPFTSECHTPALPVTDRLCDSVLVLPSGIAISEADVHGVASIICRAVGGASEIE